MEIDPCIPSDEYIFNRRYMCMVNQMDTTSKEYLKLFGSPTTGDPNIDREMANQWITTYMTIAEMASLYKENKAVRILKNSDCEDIYKSVEYHLSRWANTTKSSINSAAAPIEDLMVLDQFATTIYPFALRNTEKRKVIDSLFVNELNNTFFTFESIFGKSLDETPKDLDEEGNEKLPQRESYANAFVNKERWR